MPGVVGFEHVVGVGACRVGLSDGDLEVENMLGAEIRLIEPRRAQNIGDVHPVKIAMRNALRRGLEIVLSLRQP